jgi:hypothetical protein
MAPWIWIVIALAVVAVIAVAAWMLTSRRRSEQLRNDFGPEYDRTLNAYGDRGRAERELAARQERVEKLNIHPLDPAERTRFVEQWRSTQARFVDDPSAAIREADQLIGDVMRTRGYPVGDFEARAADISVDHPDVVSNYRAAHALAIANDQGKASTEDLRQAMVHYRALFEDLLETSRQATARG